MEKIEMIQKETAISNISRELNNFSNLKRTLQSIISVLKEFSQCEAVGIRIEENGDYPYYVFDGFTKSFIKKESSLCAIDKQGKRIKSPDGKGYLLECMCGNIIRGRFDPKFDFFTEGGSFWTNSTNKLLIDTSAEERMANTRNYCNACGYMSVALIPVKAKGETFGLIQLNDKREGMFTKDKILFYELIGQNVGLAIANSLLSSQSHENINLKKRIKKQERIIKQNEELEELRTEFFSNISHELRTPISVILNAIKLLERYKEEELLIEKSPRVGKQLNTLKNNGFRMLKIINNLIDITKFDSGAMDMNIEKCNIVNLIRQIVCTLEEFAKGQRIKVKFETDCKQKYIYCDVDKIERIMLNLLSNSIKFSESCRQIKISIIDKGDKVIISVKDCGVGIPKEKLGTIFDRFTQVDKLYTRKAEGSGLGLSIVKMLVEMHGGNVHIESIHHKGTEVFVELPALILEEADNMETVGRDFFPNEMILDKARMEFSDIS